MLTKYTRLQQFSVWHEVFMFISMILEMHLFLSIMLLTTQIHTQSFAFEKEPLHERTIWSQCSQPHPILTEQKYVSHVLSFAKDCQWQQMIIFSYLVMKMY